MALLGIVCLISCSPTNRFLEHQNAGDKALGENNYAEAERQYKAAIEIAESEGDKQALVLIGLRSLAQVYFVQGRDSEAEEIYRKRLAIIQESKDQDSGKLVKAYDDLATFYLVRNRFSEAEPLYQQAIAIRQKAFGVDSPKVAEDLEYYALLLRRINRNEEAAKLETQAKTIKSRQ